MTLLMLVTMVLATAPAAERLSVPVGEQVRCSETRLGRTSSEDSSIAAGRERGETPGQSVHPWAILPNGPSAGRIVKPGLSMAVVLRGPSHFERLLVRQALLALPPPVC